MSDEQKDTADVEAQENETIETTDELTNEELDQVAGGRQASHRTHKPITFTVRVDASSPN